MNYDFLPRKQHGAALAISMIFLVVLTILSVAALRGSGLQEKMAGGMRESNLALQAAEAALVVGERWIGSATITTRPVPITECTSPCYGSQVWGTDIAIDGSATNLDPLAYPWDSFNWGNTLEIGGVGIPLVSGQPSYIIQQSGFKPDSFVVGASSDGTYYYTVTARGLGRSAQHRAILQTVYARRF